jgi:hypothetical protein
MFVALEEKVLVFPFDESREGGIGPVGGPSLHSGHWNCQP